MHLFNVYSLSVSQGGGLLRVYTLVLMLLQIGVDSKRLQVRVFMRLLHLVA
jgi:hypothetical protein